jgi:hypothetical protein
MHELRLFLAKQTILVTIFIVYLFIAICISIIRLLRLIRMHHSFSKRQPISPENLIRGDISARLLAKMALSDRVAYQSSPGSGAPKILLTEKDIKTVQHTLNEANIEFSHLQEISCRIVRSIKRLVPFTLLVSCLVTLFDAMSILHGGYMTERKVTGIVQLLEAVADLARLLSWGIAVSLVLFVISSNFEESMIRRERYWECFVSAMQESKHDE